MPKQAEAKFSISAIDKATRTIRNINRRISSLTQPARNVSRSLRGMFREAGFRRMSQSLGRIKERMTGLGQAVGRLSLMFAAFSGGAFFGVSRIAKTGDQYAKLAKQVGFGVEELQEWGFVADRSGVQQSIFNSSMQAFTKRVGELRAGTGGLYTFLAKKGNETLAKQLLHAKNNEVAFQALMEALAGMTNENDKAALAAAAFSRSGLGMALMAAGGTKEIRRLRQEFNELGGGMDQVTAENAEKFQDSMSNLGVVVKGIAFTLGSELLPGIREIIKGMLDWWKANKTDALKDMRKFAKGLVVEIKSLVTWFKSILPKIKEFTKKMGGLKAVIIALTSLIALPFVAAALQAVAAIAMFGHAMVGLSVILFSTPFGWFITWLAGIATASFIVWKNFDKIKKKWEEIKEAFSDQGLIKRVKKIIDDLSRPVPESMPIPIPGAKLKMKVPKLFQTPLFSKPSEGGLFKHKAPALKSPRLQPQSGVDVRAGGTIRVVIEQGGPPRISEIISDNPDIDVEAEIALVGGLMAT